jgi:hypothetical protein
MKRAFDILTRLTLVVAPLFPLMEASGQPASAPPKEEPMSIWRARRTLTTATDRSDPGIYRSNVFLVDGSTFRFTPETLEFDEVSVKAGARHSKLDLRSLDPISATCSRQNHGLVYACEVKTLDGKRLQETIPSQFFLSRVIGQYKEHCNRMGDTPECAYQDIHCVSTILIPALGRLRDFANDANAPLRTYPQRAADWRAMTSKPPIPDDVRVQRLLAEDAVKAKKLDEALTHYELGLETYPTWPQGYFNAALIAAELELYAQAVEHMRAYVDLVPDAADAQSARDQIAIWQFKARK